VFAFGVAAVFYADAQQQTDEKQTVCEAADVGIEISPQHRNPIAEKVPEKNC
jgi:hypothetical protein